MNYPIFAYKELILAYDEPLSPDSKADKLKILPLQQRNIQDYLHRCFESDFRYTSITSIVENSSQMQRISDFMTRMYYLIGDIYLYEIATSKYYPFISLK